MGTELDQLKSSYRDIQSKIKAARDAADEYQQKAREIDKIYRDLKQKKEEFRQKGKAFDSYYVEKHADWKGQQWKTNYVAEADKVSTKYTNIYKEIDTNLDRLNWEKTRYENLALKQFGIIGSLAGEANKILTHIENWTN